MADYKKMYTTLFNKLTDVIEQLQEAQKQAELIYIESHDHQNLEIMPEDSTDSRDLEKS